MHAYVLGVNLHQYLTRGRPLNEFDIKDPQGNNLFIDPLFDKYQSMIQLLLRSDPADRFSCDEALPYLKGLEQQLIQSYSTKVMDHLDEIRNTTSPGNDDFSFLNSYVQSKIDSLNNNADNLSYIYDLENTVQQSEQWIKGLQGDTSDLEAHLNDTLENMIDEIDGYKDPNDPQMEQAITNFISNAEAKYTSAQDFDECLAVYNSVEQFRDILVNKQQMDSLFQQNYDLMDTIENSGLMPDYAQAIDGYLDSCQQDMATYTSIPELEGKLRELTDVFEGLQNGEIRQAIAQQMEQQATEKLDDLDAAFGSDKEVADFITKSRAELASQNTTPQQVKDMISNIDQKRNTPKQEQKITRTNSINDFKDFKSRFQKVAEKDPDRQLKKPTHLQA